MDLPTAFHDLPSESYPFTLELIRQDETVWEVRVDSPGAVHVPGQHEIPGVGPVSCRVTYHSLGEVVETDGVTMETSITFTPPRDSDDLANCLNLRARRVQELRDRLPDS